MCSSDLELVFVEVRYRSNPNFGDGLESITPAKVKRIIRAAEMFLLQYPKYQNWNCRFDVVSINGENTLIWTRDAFTT